MNTNDFDNELDDLVSAEDFLDYFGVEYQATVVQVNRLHILQRFHDYLGRLEYEPEDARKRFTQYRELLEAAYQDFVRSDARSEKVFRVFRAAEPRQTVFVPLDQLRRPE